MSRQARFQPRLQKLVLITYQSLGFGDVSLAEQLTASAENREEGGAVSDKLVGAWRAGGSHVSEMPIGALDVVLQHAGEKVGRILRAICNAYGYEAVPIAGKAHVAYGDCIQQLKILAAAELGDVMRLGPTDNPEKVAAELRELLEVVQHASRLADENALAARGVPLPLRQAVAS
jgi:hypothetical protein